jgi:hypothetical protein
VESQKIVGFVNRRFAQNPQRGLGLIHGRGSSGEAFHHFTRPWKKADRTGIMRVECGSCGVRFREWVCFCEFM